MKAMLLESLVDVKTHLITSPQGTPLSLRNIPEPTLSDGEVLLRVTRCGVCHTELDEIEGRTPPPQLPVVLGHQVVGTVMDSGSLLPNPHQQAGGLQKGQRVGVAWIASAC